MICPGTYNEMAKWLSVRQLTRHFELTEAQTEQMYQELAGGKLRQITGTPDGLITMEYTDNSKTSFQTVSDLNHLDIDHLSVQAAGFAITYTAAYLYRQAQRSSSSGGSGSNNNNNNNNNNN